jgi:signal transduction histidine kinase
VQIRDFWRTTRFKVTLINGAIFSACVIALLGMIYWQTAGYMIRQNDQILHLEAKSLRAAGPDGLDNSIKDILARDVRHISLYGLFSADGAWIAGNIPKIPAGLTIGGPPGQLPVKDGFQPDARALAIRLPWGELLVVGRDITQLAEIRDIILRALLLSGALIVTAGLLLGAALSIEPLKHIQAIQDASDRITQGDLSARLPVISRRDELDRLASIVNAMLDEVQRLVGEVKGASDSLAHDLRTPLTRLRGLLNRIEQDAGLAKPHRKMLGQAIEETDVLLGRFRALLRISEIESRERRSGFTTFRLDAILEQMRDLYAPLADSRDIDLSFTVESAPEIRADRELLFEAISNLLDNALKFTPTGGAVSVRLLNAPAGPQIEIADSGPGVPPEERAAVMQRFYRSARDHAQEGSGLGLSVVAAIARLHDYEVELSDAEPGLQVSLRCWSRLSTT